MKVSPRYLRLRAYAKVLGAINNGTLRRANTFDCIDCGNPAMEFDHRDYTKPLQVDPVCTACHGKRGHGLPDTNGPDIEVDWITSKLDSVKDGRLHLRLTEQEFGALQRLAEVEGTTMSGVVRSWIHRLDKRRKVW